MATNTNTTQKPQRGLALSIITAVLGGLAFILTAFSATYGAILAVIAIVIGIIALVKERRYAISVPGIAAAVVGLILTAWFVVRVLLLYLY